MARLLKFIASLTLCLTLVFGFSSLAVARPYAAQCLTGGGTGCLDKISHTQTRAHPALADGDSSITFIKAGNAGTIYHHVYVITSSSAENSPGVVQPDSNGGNGRWHIAKVYNVKWENAADLDASGEVVDDSHAHVYSNIDPFSEANLYTILNNVTQFIEADDVLTLLNGTNWRLFHTDGSGDVVELVLGADNTFLISTGASGTPEFRTIAAGDVPDISATYETQLVNAAGLYAALSDVSKFWEDGDTLHAFIGLTPQKGDMLYYDGSDWVEIDWNDSDKEGFILKGTGSTGDTVPTPSNSMNFSVLTIPQNESTDAALTSLGQVHIRGDEDRLSAHVGAGGEVAGEVTQSFLNMIEITFDPTYMYAQESTNRSVPVGNISSKLYPNGITVDYIAISYNKDPDTELTADLGYADAQIGIANPCYMEVDTTNGTFSQDTDASIDFVGSGCSADNTVPAGKFMYIRINVDPADDNVVTTFTMVFHAEED